MASDDGAAGGRIILWHNDNAATADALTSLTERFMEINPHIRVSLVAVPADEMLDRYASAAELSLGPDLFIGDSTWIAALASDNLIQPLDGYDPILDIYLSTAVDNVTYNNRIYGIPYELAPNALYYNADIVEVLPATLNELLEQAVDGTGTAMTTRFDRAFWGVQAFGGQPFDNAEGRVTLDQGGFASWLTWMTTAQNTSGMFLNNDRATLIDLFTSERAAYFVGTPADLPALRGAMGEDANIRVAVLPAGPGGAAGPLLHLDALMFNAASAERNTRAALQLARFLTNDENSLRLAREIGYVPANARVIGIDAQTYPIVNGFMTQARSALPLPNTEAMSTILQDGERLYRQVLDGVVDPTLAATEFTEAINAALGFAAPTQVTDRCTESGELRVWHPWRGDDAAALEQIVTDFEAFCLGTTVTLTDFNSEAELIGSYRALHDADGKPDVILASDNHVYSMANDALIQPVQGEAVQQFVPQALNALTYQNSIYGTPVTLELTVLFYNRDLATDLPRTLDDLVSDAAAGRQVGLTTDFGRAYWGISAYGGGLFDADLNLTINQDAAMVAWLTWLQQSSARPGIFLNNPEAVRAFEAGEAAYYIGSSKQLPDFTDELGQNTVALAPLPAGPVGEASPLLNTTAFMLNAAMDVDQLPLAQAFVNYATNPENQALLFDEAQLIPANINFEVPDDSKLVAIRAQVARVTVLPNAPQSAMLLQLGNDAYRAVLREDVPPEEAVAALVAGFNEQNATPTPVGTVEATADVADTAP